MIIISAPIYDRAWILPTWFEFIEKQSWPLEELGFVFEAAPNDKKTHEELFKWHESHPQVRCFDVAINKRERHQKHGPNGQRLWRRDDYLRMVNLRNSILDRVRVYQPERLFSLDTDILLENPDTISTLFNITESGEYHGVAPLAFMTPVGVRFPSVMTWINGKVGGFARRTGGYPLGEVFRADVIMAAKMMVPDLYNNVSYQFHRQGEDLGFCAAAGEKGYALASVSNVYCPHIMNQDFLENYLATNEDPRYLLLLERQKVN